MSVKISKQPPPAPTASAVGPCPTIIQIVGRPALEVYLAPWHPPTTPRKLRKILLFDINFLVPTAMN